MCRKKAYQSLAARRQGRGGQGRGADVGGDDVAAAAVDDDVVDQTDRHAVVDASHKAGEAEGPP